MSLQNLDEPSDPLVTMDQRIHVLMTWITSTSSDYVAHNTDLEAGTKERIYWHMGYVAALRDIRDLMGADLKRVR